MGSNGAPHGTVLFAVQPPITALPTRIPLSPALQVSSSSSSSSPVTVTALAVFLAPAKPGTAAASSLQDRTGRDTRPVPGSEPPDPPRSPARPWGDVTPVLQAFPERADPPFALLPPELLQEGQGWRAPSVQVRSARLWRGEGGEGGVEGGAGKALTDSSQWAPLRWLSRRQSFLSPVGELSVAVKLGGWERRALCPPPSPRGNAPVVCGGGMAWGARLVSPHPGPAPAPLPPTTRQCCIG